MGKKIAIMLTVIAAVGLLGSTALTAANTLPASTKAGAGSVAISGYTATKIDYTLDGTDPSNVASVAIDITGGITTGSSAKLQLASAGSWYDCTIGAYDSAGDKTPLSCTTTGAAVSTANNLTLVIAD